MAAKPKSPILDLPALQTRPIARIHGTNYELRHPAELSLWDRSRLATLGGQLEVIDKPQPTKDELAAASEALRDICGVVLIAPAKVIDKLTDQQRLAVAMVFTALSPTMRRLMMAGAETIETATAPRTPATSLPDSSASTGARRRSGSATSRTRTSVRA